MEDKKKLLKDSLEELEIPESLLPENIEKKPAGIFSSSSAAPADYFFSFLIKKFVLISKYRNPPRETTSKTRVTARSTGVSTRDMRANGIMATAQPRFI